MMNKKQEAIKNDGRIWDIARYHASKGGFLQGVKAIEALPERFNEFKALVKRGSMTINQLEDRVYEEFGVVTEDPYDKSIRTAAEIERELNEEEIRLAREDKRKTNEQKQK